MIIPVPLVIEYQKTLVAAALDYFSASDVLSNAFGGQFGGNVNLWKDAVIEFLRINFTAELIKIAQVEDNFHPILDNEEILHRLFQSDPNEDLGAWMGVRFEGTEKLNELVVRCGLLDWTAVNGGLNENFVDTLHKIYSRMNK